MFDGGFKLIGQYGSKGSEIGQFNHPRGMCFDRKSNLVVCDYYNIDYKSSQPPLIHLSTNQ
jgi:hypothetical protein